MPAFVDPRSGPGANPVRWSHGASSRAFRYSAWDGSQVGFDLDAESLLDEMSDDLLYHGDLNAALRRMMQQGFRDRNDERLMGCAR